MKSAKLYNKMAENQVLLENQGPVRNWLYDIDKNWAVLVTNNVAKIVDLGSKETLTSIVFKGEALEIMVSAHLFRSGHVYSGNSLLNMV